MDFAVVDATLATVDPTVVQVPIVGNAIVVAYNLGPSSPSTDPTLILDRPTLAKIWMGQITTWDDPAIVARNPGTFTFTKRTVYYVVMFSYAIRLTVYLAIRIGKQTSEPNNSSCL